MLRRVRRRADLGLGVRPLVAVAAAALSTAACGQRAAEPPEGERAAAGPTDGRGLVWSAQAFGPLTAGASVDVAALAASVPGATAATEPRELDGAVAEAVVVRDGAAELFVAFVGPGGALLAAETTSPRVQSESGLGVGTPFGALAARYGALDCASAAGGSTHAIAIECRAASLPQVSYGFAAAGAGGAPPAAAATVVRVRWRPPAAP